MLFAEPPVRLVIVGALGALVAGGLIAFAINASHRGERPAPPPASQGGLIIDPEGAEVGRIDAARPLRCFVAGALVGELSLKDCAKRNGVATEALDVGLDASGVLAAGEPKATPLPPTPAAAPAAEARAAAPKEAACWRYAERGWRQLPSETTLNGCVLALFAGRCETPGNASYGRWGQQTLRLAPGKVEISGDNSSFRTLVEQGPGCAFPSLRG
jgi:hypothetical protein